MLHQVILVRAFWDVLLWLECLIAATATVVEKMSTFTLNSNVSSPATRDLVVLFVLCSKNNMQNVCLYAVSGIEITPQFLVVSRTT